MKGEKIIEKKLNFNVTTLVIHDKELSDRLKCKLFFTYFYFFR